MCRVSIPAAAHAAAGPLRSTAEPVQHHHQLRCQRCVEHVWDAPVVQRELHRRRMQEQALEPDLLAQALVDVRIAILVVARDRMRSEEHTSELQSLMRISYAVFCLKQKKHAEYI